MIVHIDGGAINTQNRFRAVVVPGVTLKPFASQPGSFTAAARDAAIWLDHNQPANDGGFSCRCSFGSLSSSSAECGDWPEAQMPRQTPLPLGNGREKAWSMAGDPSPKGDHSLARCVQRNVSQIVQPPRRLDRQPRSHRAIRRQGCSGHYVRSQPALLDRLRARSAQADQGVLFDPASAPHRLPLLCKCLKRATRAVQQLFRS